MMGNPNHIVSEVVVREGKKDANLITPTRQRMTQSFFHVSSIPLIHEKSKHANVSSRTRLAM